MASYPQCITDISIHALLAESDGMSFSDMYPYDNFYPRSPCGERLVVNKQRPRSYIFLSTLSLRRATFGKNKNAAESQKFLSTLSLRRATVLLLCHGFQQHNFYPRSPCGERPSSTLYAPSSALFLSTLSLRRATCKGCGHVRVLQFLSTLSLRRATRQLLITAAWYFVFLSTLSLRRTTAPNRRPYHCNRNFYPRSPCGERLNGKA